MPVKEPAGNTAVMGSKTGVPVGTCWHEAWCRLMVRGVLTDDVCRSSTCVGISSSSVAVDDSR